MTAATPNLADRVRGALLGAAVGNALGAPFEFMSANQIQIRHGRVSDMVGGGWRGVRPGEYTEDVAMMLCLLDSLMVSGKYSEEDAAARYLRWYASGPRHVSNIVKATLEGAAESGGTLTEWSAQVGATYDEDRQEGSGLLRAVPLGLLFHRRPDRVVESCLSEARLTHHDKQTGSVAAALGLLVAALLNRLDKRESLKHAVGALGRSEAQTVLPVTDAWPRDLPPGPRAIDALQSTLGNWLATRGFRAAVEAQVNQGGDADTCGGLMGALAGARYGASSIPREWLDRLQDRPLLEEIVERFARLVAGSSGGRDD